MIRVLIVEDDPMVAEFNKRYLARLEGFSLAGTVHNVENAKDLLEQQKVDLILLDLYMPNQNGIELLKYLREHDRPIDTILITAASEVDKIQTALRYGASDYLIKPFEFDRFSQALEKYKGKFHFFNSSDMVRQKELDEKVLTMAPFSLDESNSALPKGVTRSTLQSVFHVIKARESYPFSTEDIAEETNISRVSIRKYLKFLTDIHVLDETLTYGIGRPVYLYTFKKDHKEKMKAYL